jgi:ribosomal protein L37E
VSGPVATVRTRCERCGAWNSFEADEPLRAIGCGGCEAPIPLSPTERLLSGGPVDRCWRCGRAEFWTKKDFPQAWGLAIAGAAAVAAFWTYGLSLVAAALFDLALYLVLPAVTICYACRTEYRGVPADPAQGPFDLARQEDIDEALEAAKGKREGAR